MQEISRVYSIDKCNYGQAVTKWFFWENELTETMKIVVKNEGWKKRWKDKYRQIQRLEI